MNFAIYQASRIGGRKYNQDRAAYAYSNESLLMVLADGMGGHLYGEIAAQLAVKTFTEAFKQSAKPHIPDMEAFLHDTLERAHNSIIQYASEQNFAENPGTTCVVALVQDGQACWAHAGDSRLYLLRGSQVMARTRDHSMVQQWADWGIISQEEMKTHPDRNKIINCLGGVEDMFFVESSPIMPLQQGDTLLLCSDGLWGSLSEPEMAAVFSVAPPAVALEQLIDEAAHRAGAKSDNITAIAAHWSSAEKPHTTSSPVSVVLECS